METGKNTEKENMSKVNEALSLFVTNIACVYREGQILEQFILSNKTKQTWVAFGG